MDTGHWKGSLVDNGCGLMPNEHCKATPGSTGHPNGWLTPTDCENAAPGRTGASGWLGNSYWVLECCTRTYRSSVWLANWSLECWLLYLGVLYGSPKRYRIEHWLKF